MCIYEVIKRYVVEGNHRKLIGEDTEKIPELVTFEKGVAVRYIPGGNRTVHYNVTQLGAKVSADTT